MKRNIVVLVIVALLLGIAIFQNYGEKKEAAALPAEQAPKVGFIAPEFTLGALDDKQYSVTAGQRDKALLINFWASWCGPCHAEAPDLNVLYEKYSDQLDIYAINATEWDVYDNALDFVDQYQFQFPVLMDLDDKVVPLYRVRSYPTNLLVDSEGVIVEKFDMLTADDIKTIEKFLKKNKKKS